VWKAILAAAGGVVAALASALCCVGPLVALVLGVSGAGLANTFEPLRPYFMGVAAASLGGGFLLLRREERRACEPDRLCASPTARRWMRAALWTGTALAVVFVTFPTWIGWILD
jgi:mercuric ion transport protein